MLKPIENGRHAYEMVLTPDDIKEVFNRNKRSGFVNRKLSKLTVGYYKHLMLTGKWRLSNDAICITKDGELINGQSRLTAALETNMTQHFLVMPNADRDMFSIIDTGRKRSAADFLYANSHGVKNPRPIATAVSFILSLLYLDVIPYSCSDRVEYSRDYELVQSCYEKFRDMFNRAATYYANYPTPKLMSSIANISCHVLFAYSDAVKAEQFFDILRTKRWGDNTMFINLYNALLRLPMSMASRYKTNIQFQMLVTAWNAYCAGTERLRFGYKKPDDGHIERPTIAGFDKNAFLDGINTANMK